MKIKFTTDYAGRETCGKSFAVDDVLELDHQPAIELIAAGVAVEFTEDAPEPKKEKVKHGKN